MAQCLRQKGQAPLMTTPSRILLFFFSLSLLFQRCDCKRLCTNAMPEFNFVNFDSTDLNAIILEGYNNDGTYTRLLDKRIYSNKPIPGPDTFQMTGNVIYPDVYYDYILTIPAVNKSWRIRGISLHHESNNVGTCTGGMTYYLNDSLIVIPGNYTMANMPAIINILK